MALLCLRIISLVSNNIFKVQTTIFSTRRLFDLLKSLNLIINKIILTFHSPVKRS